MKTARFAALAAAVLSFACCSQPSARIDGVLKDAPETDVIVRLLDVNKYQTLDTVKTDAAGAYSYKVDVEEGKPEFIYLFNGDRKIASLLLQKGDRVKVVTEPDGTWTVEGSEESEKLRQVEKEYADFQVRIAALRQEFAQADGTPEAREIQGKISRAYVEYYRKAVAYVLSNSHSLTSVPVLYQNVDEGFQVFSQPTDALHFRSLADSLKTVYPESRYVKALAKEADRRYKALEMGQRLELANEIGYVDIDLPDVNGKRVKLSDLDSRAVLLYFWAATDEMKMFNLDSLLPVYETFHDRGFDIYSVSFDVDKTAWATVVRNQKLPWTQVCDVRGDRSPLFGYYGITGLPRMALLVDGEIVSDTGITSEATLRQYLSKVLK